MAHKVRLAVVAGLIAVTAVNLTGLIHIHPLATMVATSRSLRFHITLLMATCPILLMYLCMINRQEQQPSLVVPVMVILATLTAVNHQSVLMAILSLSVQKQTIWLLKTGMNSRMFFCGPVTRVACRV